jgi:hypothetical protein
MLTHFRMSRALVLSAFGAGVVGVMAWSAGCSGSGSAAAPGVTATEPISMSVNAPLVVAPTVEDWTFDGTSAVPGKAINTTSFRIMTTVASQGMQERLPVFMETALRHYLTSITSLPVPQGQMNLYMMANRPQWERLTQRVMGSEADVYLRIERGGFTARNASVLWDIGRRDTLAISAHEGWHLYTQRAFRDPLPIGLEEGVATFMEGFRWNTNEDDAPSFLPWANGERFWQLRQAASQERLVAIDELLLLSPQDLMGRSTEGALDYYAQVWALTHFLVEGDNGRYRPALEQMLRDAAAGRLNDKIREKLGPRAASIHNNRRRGVDVLSVYTDVPSSSLDDSYKAFVARIVRTGTWQRIWRGESPIP